MAGLSDATKDRFQRLVADIVVPPLKAAGYRKQGLVWHRRSGRVTPVVDIQRGWGSEHDHTEFTLNWGLYVPEFEVAAFGTRGASPKAYKAPVAGRVGAFSDREHEIWWQIEAGRLGRNWPSLKSLDDRDCEREIGDLLGRMLRFLDENGDFLSLVRLVDEAVLGPDRAPGGATLQVLPGGRAVRDLLHVIAADLS